MSGNWRSLAACRDRSPALFIAEEDESRRLRLMRESRAKAVCACCPSRLPCLEFALATGTAHGIWGGMNGDERKALAVEQGRPRLCGNGLHVMDEPNTYTYPNGWKTCRACKDVQHQRRREQQRANERRAA